MALVKRLEKGSPLTFAEGDANLDYLASNTGSLVTTSSFNTYTASLDPGGTKNLGDNLYTFYNFS